jgi:hypothetical protein
VVEVNIGDKIIWTFFRPLFDFRNMFMCLKECSAYSVITSASIPFVYDADPYG